MCSSLKYSGPRETQFVGKRAPVTRFEDVPAARVMSLITIWYFAKDQTDAKYHAKVKERRNRCLFGREKFPRF